METIPVSKFRVGTPWLESTRGAVEVTGDELAPALPVKRWKALRA